MNSPLEPRAGHNKSTNTDSKSKRISKSSSKDDSVKKYYYYYPITRYAELYSTLESDVKLKGRKTIMSFYDTKITDQDKVRILNFYEENPENDVFCYYKDSGLESGKECLYKDIVGGLNFFEGLCPKSRNEPNHFIVSLGS